MKIQLLCVTVLVIVATGEELQEFQNSNLHFSSDVYTQLSTKIEGNFLVCPLSAQVILSLATVGARENTAKQLCNALHLPDDRNQIENIFEKINQNLDVQQSYQFISANKIFVKNNFGIKSTYIDIAVNKFKAGIENINFNDKKTATQTINDWIESKTQDKIKNLIQEDIIKPDLLAILVNALYFEGKWVYKFGNSLGYRTKFYINKNRTVEFNAMTQRNDFNYYKNIKLKAEFLELPFVGDDVTMTFVLPKDGEGISELEKHILDVLSPQPLEKVDAIITLPIFKMESQIKFKEILESLGVTDPFSRKANFKEISDVPLYINDVIQKTFIEINEIGATAAAATEITLMKESLPRVMFTTNRPFIYFLKHKVTGVFFIGRFSTPEN